MYKENGLQIPNEIRYYIFEIKKKTVYKFQMKSYITNLKLNSEVSIRKLEIIEIKNKHVGIN